MTARWGRTFGAALVVTALCVPAPGARAQATGGGSAAPRPSRKAPGSLPPLPITQIDARPAAPDARAEQQKPPQPIRPLGPVPATQLDERLPAPRGGQDFSLSFAEPQPIRDVLLLMLKDTGLSVVIDPDVVGTFTGELASVTLKQALEITLQPLGLAYTLEKNVLHVFRRPTETRFFSVDYVAAKRSRGQAAATGTEVRGGGDARASSSGPGHAAIRPPDGADFYDELGTTIGALLSDAGQFTLDRKAGLVQVTDYPDRLDRISRYLELAELRATRQVQIEAAFLEVDLNETERAGIDWTAALQAANALAKAPAPLAQLPQPGRAFSLGVASANLDTLLEVLSTRGNVRVLARTRVTAMNNEPAIIRAATEHVAPSTGVSRREKTDRGTRVAPAPATDAVALTVTPQISADGIIHMSVAPSIAVAGGGIAGATQASTLPDDPASVAVSGAETLARVHEGDTVVLGGMMRTSIRRDAPVQDRGDKGTKRAPGDAATRTELVILLTPKII